LRKVFALRLFPDGSVTEQPDFLALAGHDAPASGLWQRRFSDWTPAVSAAANRVAAAVAERIVSASQAIHRDRIDRDAIVVRSWMAARCAELCGAGMSRTLDLFATEPPDDWRTNADPEQRLAGFAADLPIEMPRRREAADVLQRFRAVATREGSLPRPITSVLGMLMLVP
jgi:hypothetical protein